MTTAAPLLGEPLPVEFMNTVWADRDGVHDALDAPAQATDWLAGVAAGLDVPLDDEPGALSGAQRARVWALARDLRDALRRLAAETTGDDRPGAASAIGDVQRAVTVVNGIAAHAPRWSTLEGFAHGSPARRGTRTAGFAPDAALAQLAEEAIDLFSGTSADALRACQAPGCVLYFVKRHPRREWCSAGCGNRARVARHYQRHHAARD